MSGSSIFCLLVLGIFLALFLRPLNGSGQASEALKDFGQSIFYVFSLYVLNSDFNFGDFSTDRKIGFFPLFFCLFINTGLDTIITSVRYSSTIPIVGLIRFTLSTIVASSIGIFYLDPNFFPVFTKFHKTNRNSDFMGATLKTHFALNIMYTRLTKVSELLTAFLTRLSQEHYENVAFAHFSRYFASEHRFFTNLPLWKKILVAIPTAIVHCAADLLLALLIGFFSILRRFSHQRAPLLLTGVIISLYLVHIVDTFIPLYFDPQFELKNLFKPLLSIFTSLLNGNFDVTDAKTAGNQFIDTCCLLIFFLDQIGLDVIRMGWSMIFKIKNKRWAKMKTLSVEEMRRLDDDMCSICRTSVWEGLEEQRDESPKEEAADKDIAKEDTPDPDHLTEHADAAQEQDDGNDVHLRRQFEDGREEQRTDEQDHHLQPNNFQVWDEQLLDQPAHEIPAHLLAAPSSFLGLFPHLHRRFLHSLLVPTFTFPSQTPCGHTFHKECLDDWLVSQSTCPYCRQSLTIGGRFTRSADAVQNERPFGAWVRRMMGMREGERWEEARERKQKEKETREEIKEAVNDLNSELPDYLQIDLSSLDFLKADLHEVASTGWTLCQAATHI
ncbi:hypothetical protein BLNAU_20561 [Blattamonas nauphoetae]|uniref:RING-type domain-containing protein n=1 Tax=Blattamonas nauphoetae TaxID=2049346 RepID=A0ABQ9WYH5_9EUKA|nr:hypothetical protein BLNAU_20561 [Blattamonas nauphoetae]